MAATTIEDIRTTAPEVVDSFDDDSIQALIDQATLIALSDRFPRAVVIDGNQVPIRDMATLDMTLHLASTQSASGRGVISEKVDVLEEHYADTTNLDWLDSSPWGQAYLRLYQMYGGGGVHYTVVQH